MTILKKKSICMFCLDKLILSNECLCYRLQYEARNKAKADKENKIYESLQKEKNGVNS
jgi:hypothetical protein